MKHLLVRTRGIVPGGRRVGWGRGFTLIELLIVIGVIAILATVVVVAINPARQFAQARNSQRVSNVTTILNAIGQNIAENRGVFMCNGISFDIGGASSTAGIIASGAVGHDLAPCLVPVYITALPVDPTGTSTCTTPMYTDEDSYNTCYEVSRDAAGRITVRAPSAELGEEIEVTR